MQPFLMFSIFFLIKSFIFFEGINLYKCHYIKTMMTKNIKHRKRIRAPNGFKMLKFNNNNKLFLVLLIKVL